MMQPAANLYNPPPRVAVIDDERLSRDSTMLMVSQAKLTPVALDPTFSRVDDLVDAVMNSADGAIIDHRLQLGALIPFFGAEVVAALVRRGKPAILTTQYFDQDFDVSIRQFRDAIPVVIPYDDVDAAGILEAFTSIYKELTGEIPESRKPRRALVHLKAMRMEAGMQVFDVIVPAWNPKRSVSFPADLLLLDVGEAQVGAWLEADVNIGSERPEDLFFMNFTVAAEPDSDDGLGDP